MFSLPPLPKASGRKGYMKKETEPRGTRGKGRDMQGCGTRFRPAFPRAPHVPRGSFPGQRRQQMAQFVLNFGFPDRRGNLGQHQLAVTAAQAMDGHLDRSLAAREPARDLGVSLRLARKNLFQSLEEISVASGVVFL